MRTPLVPLFFSEVKRLTLKYLETSFTGYIYDDFWPRLLDEPLKIQIYEAAYSLNDALIYLEWQITPILRREVHFEFISFITQFVGKNALIYDVIIITSATFSSAWFALMWHWYDNRTYRLRDPFVLPFSPDFLYTEGQKTKWHKRATQAAFWSYSILYYYEDNLENHGWIVPYVVEMEDG